MAGRHRGGRGRRPTPRFDGARRAPGRRPHVHRPRPPPGRRTGRRPTSSRQSSNVGTIMIAQQLGARAPRRLPPALRLRRARPPSTSPTRPAGILLAARRLVGHVDRHHPHRPGHLGDRPADARRLQRRSPTTACTCRPDSVDGHRRRRRRASPTVPVGRGRRVVSSDDRPPDERP